MRACVYGYRNVVEDDGRLKGRVKSGTVNATRRKGYPSYPVSYTHLTLPTKA